MKFLRNVDKISYSLAMSQARIFEKSVSYGIPSKIFIRSFMLSDEASFFDKLNIDIVGLSEGEIFDNISKKISNKKGIVYSYSIMRFIGYFYRTASYLTNLSSKYLYKNIKPEILARNYNTLHSLAIEEAIKEIFELLNIQIEDKYSLFAKIYKMDNI